MRFDFDIHKKQWMFGIDFTYSKEFKSFYLHFAIWSVGFFKVEHKEEE